MLQKRKREKEWKREIERGRQRLTNHNNDNNKKKTTNRKLKRWRGNEEENIEKKDKTQMKMSEE